VSIAIEAPIWAAGAVPLRGPKSSREVMIVHRPAYDDWSLPKGKAHPHELLPATAVREVEEETGVRVRLGAELTPLRYPIGQTMKLVSWWVGVPLSSTKHSPNAEVDRACWMSVDKAMKTLTYSDEREVLAEAVGLPRTTPLVIIRHAKAMRREKWVKPDPLRPLSRKGKEQLAYVSQILGPFGVANLLSSSSIRCVQTLQTYAKSIHATVATAACLTEEGATEKKVRAYMTDLARVVGSSGIPTAVCGHRPVLPLMFSPLLVPDRELATGSCVIAHMDGSGKVVRTEWHDTLRVKQ